MVQWVLPANRISALLLTSNVMRAESWIFPMKSKQPFVGRISTYTARLPSVIQNDYHCLTNGKSDYSIFLHHDRKITTGRTICYPSWSDKRNKSYISNNPTNSKWRIPNNENKHFEEFSEAAQVSLHFRLVSVKQDLPSKLKFIIVVSIHFWSPLISDFPLWKRKFRFLLIEGRIFKS